MTEPVPPTPQNAALPPEPPAPARREPLPEESPKSPIEDPGAPERLRRILESPSYVRADRDLALLMRSELRPERLELEYLKAELALREHRIASTIVVFGGTRIVEPAAAARKVRELDAELVNHPNDRSLRRKLASAKRIEAKSKYYDVAREFSQIVSRERQTETGAKDAGAPLTFVVATGGGPGVMEAANRGAYDVGAKSLGLNITLPMEQFPNPYITPELCFQFRYFALRKFHFMQRAKALVAFPGGYGTLDELFEALCLIQTRKMTPIPVVLVGESFWRGVWNAEFLADEGVIADEDVKLFAYAETARQIWDHIVEWYECCAPEISTIP